MTTRRPDRAATFRYFAYGSNMATARMRGRCPSARVIGTASLEGWTTTYDKPSTDGTAKLNVRPQPGAIVSGVIYEIDEAERASLDAAEPRYSAIETPHGLLYAYAGPPAESEPADWYVDLVESGARSHGLPAPARETRIAR